MLSGGCARTHAGKNKSCSCAIVNRTWRGLAGSLLQQKDLPCSLKHTASCGCGCGRSMCRPHVFTTMTMSVFARPAFARCLPAPICLCGDACVRNAACLHLNCLREVSSRPMCLCRPVVGSVFARPRVLATTRVFACHVYSRRHGGSSPDLSSGRVLARPRVLATTRALARPVFEVPLARARAVRSGIFSGRLPDLRSRNLRHECVFRRPRVFAVFAWHASADVWVSSQPCFEASVLDRTCLQNVPSAVGQYVHPHRRSQCKNIY